MDAEQYTIAVEDTTSFDNQTPYSHTSARSTQTVPMSEKLRKYLAYYQKVLNAEPENIEARLRLAAIFREMGKDSHAVAEYVTASKLLAKEGLPLEAIAACKAVLELEPGHTEVQYFLARLFAQVPDATGESVRVARPVDPMVARQTPARAMTSAAVESTPVPRGESTSESSAPITLERRKPGETTRRAVVPSGVWDVSPIDDELETTRPGDLEEGSLSEETSPLDFDDDPATGEVEAATDRDDDTSPLLKNKGIQTKPTEVVESFDAPTKPLRPLDPNKYPLGGARQTFETFEVNVFDMESLELDEESEMEFEFLDSFDGEVSEFSAEEVSETIPAVFRVSRDDLPKIPLLSNLSPDLFARLLPMMDLERIPARTTILAPGHSSRTLYIVVKGVTRVSRDIEGEEVELATMNEGDFFGEFMLLTGRSGSATVRAQTDCELLALHETVVHEIGDRHPELWDALWDFYYDRMLNNLLASSDIFRPLDADARHALAAKFEMHEVVANEVFISEGQPCRHLHLILNGEIEVERHVGGKAKTLATLREGEFFGVASSLNDEPYLADVRAVRDTVILRLPSTEFRAIADGNEEIDAAVQLAIMSRRELNAAFVSGVTAYAELGVAKAE